ncbi:Homeobox protein DBX1-A [Nymphon striatum]|nr:Homeobox protein DBX1-A [Nymphon striatum]
MSCVNFNIIIAFRLLCGHNSPPTPPITIKIACDQFHKPVALSGGGGGANHTGMLSGFTSSGGSVLPLHGTFSHIPAWTSALAAARGKPRRGMLRRAVFSDVQRKGLEKRFQLQKYISKPDRKKLAEKLGLKDSQISFRGRNKFKEYIKTSILKKSFVYMCIKYNHDAKVKKLNSLFTKFLKYYLGIPYSASNSITHYMTNTIPLSHLLRQLQDKSLLSVKVPSSLSGFKLHSSFILNSTFHSSISDLIPNIPSWFWYSRPVHSLPTNKFSRRATCYDSFDLFHSHLCATKTYHSCPTDTCICSYCSAPASHYHHRSCSILHTLSPPQLLSLLTM